MDKVFDIFIGRLDGYHTKRVVQSGTACDVAEWIKRGYKIQCEHQIGVSLYQVYLVKSN